MVKKRKTKIIIFPGYFVPHMGGLETHVDEFVKYLSKRKKYGITIFTPNIPEVEEYEIIHNNVKVIRYPAFDIVSNFPLPKFWTLKFWRMYLDLYSNRYDIVMSRTRFFFNSSLAMFFAKFRLWGRKKFVHVEHGSDFVKLSSKFKSFMAYMYDMTLGKMTFYLSDKTVAISKTVHKFIKTYFLKKRKVPIITRGIDFSIYDSKKDNEIENKFKGKLKMCFLGRLYAWKGVDEAIKAYKMLDSKLKKKVVYLVVGDGEDRERLESLAGVDLNKGIYFLGAVPFDRAIRILNSVDVYVHSAFPGGGLSNSLLQAMYTNCAIVASPHEGANEVINSNTGILLKNNSVKSLSKGMEELVSSQKLRDKFGENAHKLAKENFDWKKIIEKYDRLFDEVNR